jgi:hypothetical protein
LQEEMLVEKNLAVQTFEEQIFFRRHHNMNLRSKSQQKWKAWLSTRFAMNDIPLSLHL